VSRRLTWLDVFTSTPFAGNGLAVVHDADGVSDASMLAFARETSLSETSFLQSADDCDYRHRIWMVRGEIPFAGHPSLGAAVAYVRARGEREAQVVQRTGPGLQPIDVEVDGDLAQASMLQEPVAFGPELDPAEVLRIVGLEAADADADLPVQVVSTGVAQVVACVRDAAALDRLRAPADDALAALLDAHGAITLYLAAVDGERAVARSFFPGGEDPATGSAAGPLLAHAHARGGTTRLDVDQGLHMGRPSRLRTSIEEDRVRVGGDAVVVLDGQVRLDT
jgi:trans-2,3-dihydro-3-hydroxyanthranilate isomerase